MGRRVPRTRCGERWTEARFFGFLRANLRMASRKWQPFRDALDAVKWPIAESTKEARKWVYYCERCKGYYPRKEVEVHHVEPVGQLKSFDDLPVFVSRLFCEADKLVVLCEACHQEETHG